MLATPETIEKLQDMLLDKLRLKVLEIVKAWHYDSVDSILNNQLVIRQSSEGWVSHLLIAEDKSKRVTTSGNCNREQFLRRFIFADERCTLGRSDKV